VVNDITQGFKVHILQQPVPVLVLQVTYNASNNVYSIIKIDYNIYIDDSDVRWAQKRVLYLTTLS